MTVMNDVRVRRPPRAVASRPRLQVNNFAACIQKGDETNHSD